MSLGCIGILFVGFLEPQLGGVYSFCNPLKYFSLAIFCFSIWLPLPSPTLFKRVIYLFHLHSTIFSNAKNKKSPQFASFLIWFWENLIYKNLIARLRE